MTTLATLEGPPLAGSDELTHSRRQTFKRCAYEHYLAYELGIRAGGTTPVYFRIGGSIHLGLDIRGKGESVDVAIARAIAGYEEVPEWANDEEKLHEWMVERVKVAELLAGYFWRWEETPRSDDLTIAEYVESEKVFRLPILNPATGAQTPIFSRAGKRDKVVRLGDGRLAVMEHKTCGEDIGPESDYWKRLRIDEQISEYVVTARMQGHNVAAVLYDVIRKPSIAPKQVPLVDADGFKIVLDRDNNRVWNKNKAGDPTKPRESADAEKGWALQSRRETPKEYGARLRADIRERPDFYFQRREIPRLDKDLEWHEHEVWQIQQSIREAQKHGRWYRNSGSCLSKRRCPYLDICHNAIEPGSELPQGFRRVTDIHEELIEDGE